MANDTSLYGDNDSSTLMVGDYAERSHYGMNIQVRGSKFTAYDCNTFTPEAARRLARYIIELADDIDMHELLGISPLEESRESRESPEQIAARRVSVFFDTLVDECFGPELARAITTEVAPVIVSRALCEDKG